MSGAKNLLLIWTAISFITLTNYSCKKDDNNSQDETSTIVFNPSLSYGTTTDQQGNSYKTITIGNQTWMAENLRVTRYNNGADIARILVDSAWFNTTTGAYDSYNSTNNADTIRNFGLLYNWYAASSNKLAPAGWHVATQSEWDTLVAHLGGVSNAGGKLKETGLSHWGTPNNGATNESGFTALPGGRFYLTSTNFTNYSFSAYFWSATSYSGGEGIAYSVSYNDDALWKGGIQKKNGFSVRCVKD